MLKKRWLVATVVVAVMAIGVTGGAALAQEQGDPEAKSPLQSLASRVASILGLDEQVVKDALDQARRELHDEAVERKLAQLVEKGRLTQEQADEYLQWYRSRPEFTPGFGRRGLQGPGFHKGRARFRGGARGFHRQGGVQPGAGLDGSASSDSA